MGNLNKKFNKNQIVLWLFNIVPGEVWGIFLFIYLTIICLDKYSDLLNLPNKNVWENLFSQMLPSIILLLITTSFTFIISLVSGDEMIDFIEEYIDKKARDLYGKFVRDYSNKIDANELYLVHGLNKATNEHNNLFQDFICDQKNYNPIYFLWTDTTVSNNKIEASVVKENDDNSFLQIIFTNGGGKGCNIAIRPQNGNAIDNSNSKGKKNLRFQAEISKSYKKNDVLGLAVRVVNGYMQHWEYKNTNNDCLSFAVNKSGNGTNIIDVELTHKDKWQLFQGDGNKISNLEKNPNFDIISLVIISFGGFISETNHPKEGKGIINLKKTELCDNNN